METQCFESLFLVDFVGSSREVAHDFEGRSGDSSHPEIDVLHMAFFRQQEDVDLALLVTDLQLAYALLFYLLAFDLAVLLCLENQSLLTITDDRVIFLTFFLNLLVGFSVQAFFNFAADVKHLAVFDDLLGQLAEKLLLRRRLEFIVFLGLKGVDGLVRALVHVLLDDLIHDLKENSVGEFGL